MTSLPETEVSRNALGSIQYWLAVVFIIGWTGVICGGLAFQFFAWEYPCPLCMLQRMFMTLAALGGVYIVRKGMDGVIEPRDYMVGWGMAIVASIGGGFTAWRQTMLHILPGDPGYAGAFLGLHLYVWSWVLFTAAVAVIGVVFTFSYSTAATHIPASYRTVGKLAIWFCGAVIVINLVAVFLLEGFHWKLPDDPACYQIFYDLGILNEGCILPG
ncbi:disulfide bond formation protein B [Mycolicibacterium sp. XJ870]